MALRLASPNVLARNGWRRERLKVGADITVTRIPGEEPVNGGRSPRRSPAPTAPRCSQVYSEKYASGTWSSWSVLIRPRAGRVVCPGRSSQRVAAGSAAQPRRPMPSARGRLSRARPDTYRPDPRRPSLPVFGYFGPQLLPYPYIQPIIVVGSARTPLIRRAVRAACACRPAGAVRRRDAGRPKTFYIIPGCYAGDRRPEPESLAPGCSISRLRVVPPS